MTRKEQDSPAYDRSSQAASKPLTEGDVARLLEEGGHAFAKDPALVRHLLERIQATLRDHQRKLGDLHDDVDRIRGVRAENEHPMTRAASALRELSIEQQAKLLDGNYIAALEELEQERLSVETVKVLAVNDINRVRALLSGLLDDENLPASVEAKIRGLLEQLSPMRN